MKQIYIIVVLLLLVNSSSAQWVQQNSGTQVDLYSLSFTDSISGYAVGDSGTILKTINGGTTWVVMNSATTDYLSSVYFVNDNTGFVVGAHGTILKTINAGVTWTELNSGISFNLYSVYFTDVNTGFAVGGGLNPNSGTILKTNDGGSTWNKWTTGMYGEDLRSVCFSSPDTGYVVGGMNEFQYHTAVILKTTNGGTDWKLLHRENSFNEGNALTSVNFQNPSTAYFVGMRGRIMETSDVDTTFITHSSGTHLDLTSVQFSPTGSGSNVGFVVGVHGTILKKRNGDTTWISQASGTTNSLNSIALIDSNKGYIAGNKGTILKTSNGGGLGLNEIQNSNQPLKIYPNPASDYIMINSFEPGNGKLLTIYNPLGNEVINRWLKQSESKVDLSSLNGGIYIFKLESESKVQMGKIIKK